MKGKIMKRILALALVLVLSAGFGTAALAATYVEATGGRVNVRSGPGENYDDLWTMVKGERVSYLGQSSTDSKGVTWFKVQYYSYGTGWVSSQLSSLVGSGSAGVGSASYVEGVNGDTYLRSAPNLNGNKLGVLHEGETANYLGSSSVDDRGVTWYYITHGGKTGWVSSRYAELYGASASLPSFSVGSGTVQITGGRVNLRSTPNLNGDDLGTILDGTVLTYLGNTSVDDRGVAWYKVSWSGKTGWVSSRYSTLYASISSVPSFDFISSTVTASGGDCNIRNAPNLNGLSLGVMKKGSTGGYLGSTSTDDRGVAWYKVSYDGMTGWVSSRYARVD